MAFLLSKKWLIVFKGTTYAINEALRASGFEKFCSDFCVTDLQYGERKLPEIPASLQQIIKVCEKISVGETKPDALNELFVKARQVIAFEHTARYRSDPLLP